jgi:amino acid permease
MRWALVFLESFATGVVSILVSLVLLVVALQLWARYVLGIGPNETVGWDPISLFGSHWKLAAMGIPAAIFAFGFSAGFWFFTKRLHG